MLWFRLIFLSVVMLSTSAYVFRCHWMCTDQTATQEDYVEQRDRCRELAQLKVDTSSVPLDDNARKAQLISNFSACMAQNGWTVPDGKEKEKSAAGGAASQAAPVSATTPFGQSTTGQPHPAEVLAPAPVAAGAASAEDKAYVARASECAFARQSADSSSIAAARAQACDIECEQYLKAAPEAPRPAACPADFKESLSKGTERQ